METKKDEKKFIKKKQFAGNKGCGKKFDSDPKSESPKGKVPYVNGVEVGHFNDPEWYYPSDTIGKQVASIPYNRPVGLKMGAVPEPDPGSMFDTPITGAALGYIPGYGSFSASTHAINIAARAMFSFVRKANSGSANYESSDLMTYVMAMDQVYIMIHELRRALMCARLFQYNNRTLPGKISKLIGIDVSDIQANFATYSAKFNILVSKVNRNLAIPKTVKIFKRRAYLAGNLFVDATSVRSQIYSLTALGYYRWTANVQGGSALEWHNWGTSAVVNFMNTFTDRLTQLDQYVTLLVSNQDIGIMCGDIIKAYGVENCYQLPLYNDETLELVHDENILQQIENCVVGLNPHVLSSGSITPANITQANNTLQCLNTFESTTDNKVKAMTNSAYQRYIVNSYKDNPDWKDNLEFTRFMAAYTIEDLGFGKGMKINVNYATEWVTCMWLVCANASDSSESFISVMSSNYDVLLTGENVSDFSTSALDAAGNYGYKIWYNQLDWRPIRKLYAPIGASAEAALPIFMGCDGDLKITTSIDVGTLQAMHDCVMLSLLDLSMIAVSD